MTVRDNVIFNLPFDPVRYAKTLDACALTKDLEMLTDGDMTEIGANGKHSLTVEYRKLLETNADRYQYFRRTTLESYVSKSSLLTCCNPGSR